MELPPVIVETWPTGRKIPVPGYMNIAGNDKTDKLVRGIQPIAVESTLNGEIQGFQQANEKIRIPTNRQKSLWKYPEILERSYYCFFWSGIWKH